ncbi:MAG: O-succinylbenzoate synthase [Micrococcales bacterium]|nr:MAG: O-succinylbenzoate synthase [Micrococcales bacterium]PIE25786.1 MAG: O-succinylbenzoate synthase [Micrococcales bacterium]PIE28088.1 MAG: O-succinylbenzoate synthase [Micrococcales bacterium]
MTPPLVHLPPLAEILDSAHVVSVPMAVRFRGVVRRESVLVKGPAGWAEFGPFSEYADAEAATWLAATVEAGWGSWPDPGTGSVTVNATVPAVPAGQVADVLGRFPGCTTAKVKVAQRGQALADDVARVLAVREAMGDGAHIRVDANGAWDVLGAMAALESLAPIGLQYAEQPCASVGELIDLRDALHSRGVRVPLAADESIRRVEDPYVVAASGAVDYVVLKVAPLGGVASTVRVGTDLAARHGVRTVVSSALETSVGMSAGIVAAAVLGRLDSMRDESGEPLAAGLATVQLLGEDVVEHGAVVEAGCLPARRHVPDTRQLERLAAPEPRRQWWLDRLSRCHGLLAQAEQPELPRQQSRSTE